MPAAYWGKRRRKTYHPANLIVNGNRFVSRAIALCFIHPLPFRGEEICPKCDCPDLGSVCMDRADANV